MRKQRSDKGIKRGPRGSGNRLNSASRRAQSGNVPTKKNSLQKSAFRGKRRVENATSGVGSKVSSAVKGAFKDTKGAVKGAYTGAKRGARAVSQGVRRDVSNSARAFRKGGLGAGLSRAAKTRTGRIGAAAGLIGAGAGVAAMVNNRRKKKQ